MTTQTLFATQGCDFSTDLQLLADDGTPVNVASYTFNGAIRRTPFSVNTYPLTVTVFDTANGNTYVTVNAATLSNMAAGAYDYALTYTTQNVTGILLSGSFVVTANPLVVQPAPYVYTNANTSEFIANANNQTANIP